MISRRPTTTGDGRPTVSGRREPSTRRRWGVGGAVALLVVLGGPAKETIAEAEIAVIVNASGRLTALTANQVRDVFLGKVRIVGDTLVIPVRLAGATEQTFTVAALGMTASAFELYWARKSFEDGVLPPPTRKTPEELLEYIRHEPRAIGFVGKASVRNVEGIRVVVEFPLPGNR